MKRPKKTTVAAWLINTVGVLVLLECILMWWRPAPPFERLTITTGGGNRYRLSPNRKLIYVPEPGTGEFNSQGYRGVVYPVSRQPDRKRVLFIGDSVVEGLGVTADERFTHLLQTRLGDTHEVINLAVRGYNLRQEVEYLRETGLAYAPDAVLVGITLNDLEINSGEVSELSRRLAKARESPVCNAYYAARSRLDTVLLKSNVYRSLRYLALRRKRFKSAVSYRLTPREAAGLVCDLRELARTREFELGFVFLPVNAQLFPDPDHIRDVREQVQTIARAVEEAGVPALDVGRLAEEQYRGPEFERLFLDRDPCHLSPQGHQVVADVLFRGLSDVIPLTSRPLKAKQP